MGDSIGDLVIGTIKSIGLGIVLLIVGNFVLPERISLWVIKRLKPDLVSKTTIMSRIRLVFDYLFNRKEVTVISKTLANDKSLENNIAGLIKEKRLLEGNLFFLDLLKNLSSMLVFSISKIGYDEAMIAEILEQSMEYLLYYGRKLNNTANSKNQIERVSNTTEIFQNQLNDTISFLSNQSGEEQIKIVKITLKQNASSFDSFMKQEYESTKNQLVTTNQLLVESFMHYIEE